MIISNLKKEIGKLADADADEAVYQYILKKISGTELDPKTTKDELAYINKLPKFLKYVFVTKLFENEVDNGGYPQFFFNHYGHFIYDVYDGLKEFGVNDAADEVSGLIKSLDKIKNLKEGIEFVVQNNTTIEQYFSDDWEKINFPFEKNFYSLESEILKKRLEYLKEHLI